MPPDLVDKGLQQDALGAGLHVHGPEGWAHPPGAGGREKGEAAGSSGQRVLRLSSVRASVCLASSLRLRGPGRSEGSWLPAPFQSPVVTALKMLNALKSPRSPTKETRYRFPKFDNNPKNLRGKDEL